MSQGRPPLTTRQARALDAIRTSVRDRGYPPTIRELSAAVGLSSSSSVVHVLQTLQARGYLTRDPGSPRSLVILDDDPAAPTIEALHLELDKDHRWDSRRLTCPGCNDSGLDSVGITALVYTYEVCTCRRTCDYDHLVEQLWHRTCHARSACVDAG